MQVSERPGQLQNRITIQTVTQSRNDTGEAIDVFTDWQTVWAKIESTAGREFFKSAQLQAEVTHRVRIRYIYPDTDHPSGVDPTMWIVFGTRRFDIRAVINPDERPIWLDLFCREVVGAPGLPDQP